MEAVAPLLIAALIFVPFYLIVVRPHRQRLAEHDELVASIAVGDEVMTTAGMYGIVRSLDAEVVELEISAGVVVRMARRAIGARVEDLPEQAA